MRDERGGIISGFLVKMIVVLSLFAVVAFEAGAIIVARVQIDGIAANAAQEAASEYGRAPDISAAKRAAARICTESGAELVRMSISRDGSILSVTARKVAKTFIVQHVGKFAKWRVAEATHEAAVH
jgi:hypothetical protein